MFEYSGTLVLVTIVQVIFWLSVLVLPFYLLGYSLKFRFSYLLILLSLFLFSRSFFSHATGVFPPDIFRHYWGNTMAVSAIFLFLLVSIKPVKMNNSSISNKAVYSLFVLPFFVYANMDIVYSIRLALLGKPYTEYLYKTKSELRMVRDHLLLQNFQHAENSVAIPHMAEYIFQDMNSITIEWLKVNYKKDYFKQKPFIVVYKKNVSDLTWVNKKLEDGLLENMYSTENYIVLKFV